MQPYTLPTQLPAHYSSRNQAHVVLQNLSRSLASLCSAAEQLLSTSTHSPATAAIYDRLQFNARRTEAAMRDLRELGCARSPSATELSQSLTVVVLVVDMVVDGHLTISDALSGDALFRRNAARAEHCLNELLANAGL